MKAEPEFQSPILNQVWWAISSDSPITHKLAKTYFLDDDHRSSLFRSFTELDKDQKQVEQSFEAPENQRLGKYFESLLRFAIENDPFYELIRHNIPIRKGKVTLGEVDFLVRNLKSDKIEHWEAALKFYLQRGHGAEGLVGPNGNDRFLDKLNRLENHQMTLGSQDSIIDLCGGTPQPKLFFKGMFFSALDTQLNFEALNENANSGWWLYVDALERLHAFNADGWEILDKRFWIGPYSTFTRPRFDTLSLIEQFNTSVMLDHRSICVVGFKEESGTWNELNRGFVVRS